MAFSKFIRALYCYILNIKLLKCLVTQATGYSISHYIIKHRFLDIAGRGSQTFWGCSENKIGEDGWTVKESIYFIPNKQIKTQEIYCFLMTAN